MNEYLLSVIVPIYNVEEYLHECVDSILNQTYKNLEVILVDDGSPDGCGKICDEYKKKDGRITVIHKENGGLSSARNVGIERAKGQFITFVDSDDYIETDMYEKMMNVIKMYQLEIVCCDYKIKEDEVSDGGLEVLDKWEAISRLLDENGYRCFACNKIFSRDLFIKIRFPEGKCYEDIFTIYRLFLETKQVLYMKEKKYIYRYRENSISKRKFSKEKYDLIEAINELMQDVQQRNIRVYEQLMPGYLRYFFYFINYAIRSDVEVLEQKRYIRKFIRKNYFRVVFSKKISKINFFQITCFMINYRLYKRMLMWIKPNV